MKKDRVADRIINRIDRGIIENIKEPAPVQQPFSDRYSWYAHDIMLALPNNPNLGILAMTLA